MAGMGPTPKPAHQRQRRNATFAMTQLPAEGRKGRAPAWPLVSDVVMAARRESAERTASEIEEKLAHLEAEGKATEATETRLERAREKAAILTAQAKHQARLEAQLWRDVWKLPHAVQWDRLGWKRDVAQYVRHKVLAELGDIASAKEARQWSDRLGLSPQAMLRLRWEIVVDETAAKRQERTTAPSRRPAAPADAFAALRAV
jgi:hypothetical protein